MANIVSKLPRLEEIADTFAFAALVIGGGRGTMHQNAKRVKNGIARLKKGQLDTMKWFRHEHAQAVCADFDKACHSAHKYVQRPRLNGRAVRRLGERVLSGPQMTAALADFKDIMLELHPIMPSYAKRPYKDVVCDAPATRPTRVAISRQMLEEIDL